MAGCISHDVSNFWRRSPWAGGQGRVAYAGAKHALGMKQR